MCYKVLFYFVFQYSDLKEDYTIHSYKHWFIYPLWINSSVIKQSSNLSLFLLVLLIHLFLICFLIFHYFSYYYIQKSFYYYSIKLMDSLFLMFSCIYFDFPIEINSILMKFYFHFSINQLSFLLYFQLCFDFLSFLYFLNPKFSINWFINLYSTTNYSILYFMNP